MNGELQKPTAGPLDPSRMNALLQRLSSADVGRLPSLPPLERTSSQLDRAASTKRKSPFALGHADLEASTSGDPGEEKGDLYERARKMQDKNRKAQARYRQRQRERMEGLDEEVVRLKGQVAELTQSNEALRRQAAESQTQAPQRPAACTACAQRAQQASAFLPFQRRGQQGGPVAAPSAPEHDPLSQVSAAQYSSALRSFLPHIAKICVGRQLNAPPEEIAHQISCEDWYLVYKSFVGELAMLVKEADKEPEHSGDARASALSQIQRMIMDKRQVTNFTSMTMSPEKLEKKTTIGLEPQKRCGPAPPSMWAKVAAAAGLSAQQKQALMGMRATFLEQLQSIIEQRRKIIYELHEAVPDGQAGSLTDTTISKALWASKHLSESIQQEHAAVWVFLNQMCHSLMTPLQEARTMVASFPFFPDPPAICNALAAEHTGAPLIAQEQAAIGLGHLAPSPAEPAARPEAGAQQQASSSQAQQQGQLDISPLGPAQVPKTWQPQGHPLLLDSTWVAGLPDLQWPSVSELQPHAAVPSRTA